MTTEKAARLALWGGLATFLLGILVLTGTCAVNASQQPRFFPSTEVIVTAYIAVFLLATGIILAMVGAVLKAFKS